MPFPEKDDSTRDLPRSNTASSSTSSADSFIDTIHEQSCPSGTCNYQQRRKCAGLLRLIFLQIHSRSIVLMACLHNYFFSSVEMTMFVRKIVIVFFARNIDSQ